MTARLAACPRAAAAAPDEAPDARRSSGRRPHQHPYPYPIPYGPHRASRRDRRAAAPAPRYRPRPGARGPTPSGTPGRDRVPTRRSPARPTAPAGVIPVDAGRTDAMDTSTATARHAAADRRRTDLPRGPSPRAGTAAEAGTGGGSSRERADGGTGRTEGRSGPSARPGKPWRPSLLPHLLQPHPARQRLLGRAPRIRVSRDSPLPWKG